MALGPHKIEYEVIKGWEQMPEGYAFVEVAGVACDSKDRVYVFCRGKHPVIVFDKEGKFLNAWGAGEFVGPHGIFIDREDHLWLADDKNHVVHKYTTDGKKLMTLGEPGKAADITAVRLDSIETQPLFNPLSDLVYAASRHQVSDVWVAGRRLMKERVLTTLDVNEIRRKAAIWREKLVM